MLSKLFASRSVVGRISSVSSQLNTLNKSAGVLVGVPRRNVSLLINDQHLEEDQKLIQKTAYDFAE